MIIPKLVKKNTKVENVLTRAYWLRDLKGKSRKKGKALARPKKLKSQGREAHHQGKATGKRLAQEGKSKKQIRHE